MELDKLKFSIVLTIFSAMTVLYAVAYDPLDPHGSINIKWDILSWTPDGYVAAVLMNNFQMYRQIMSPGWTLGWTWAKKEVIWSMVGAQATDQGDCSNFKGNIPHCCTRNPTVVDLLPGVPKTQQYSDCCKGGVLASWGQEPTAAVSSFQLSVGLSGTSNTTVALPQNFFLLGPGPGYTCSAATIVSPSVFFSSDGKRKTQAMMSWTVTCSYSQMLVSKNPSCCVSLSSFYNSKITPCPSCSCGCQNNENTSCVMSNSRISSVVEASTSMLECTSHMCPIRVHWHVKANYKEYWRVKITVTNFNYRKNFTLWTLVAQHPNLNNVTRVYSFLYNSDSLVMVLSFLMTQAFLYADDTAMFYGNKKNNDKLLEAGLNGNVQSEILLGKDMSRFTLEHGWGFPSRIYFDGDECMMPPPDSYPSLPNSAPFSPTASSTPAIFLILILLAFRCSLF
ncbi:COBRA-like protein [Populus alba x Populus x berolinensis]|nr:COBRA-like protein [Populus alba x Populus x berolinensis]